MDTEEVESPLLWGDNANRSPS